MAVFVLVHGAGGSGWVWHKVVPLLGTDHKAYTPTLTGYGARAHLASPELGLETHVRDVLGVLEYEDLRDVVLVGWSYAGMVVTAVADRAPERLAHLVYLDASVPLDGQSQADQQSPEYRATIERLLSEGAWLRPAPSETSFAKYVERGDLTEDEVRTLVARLRPVPLKTLTDPISLVNPAAATVPRTYARCRQNAGDTQRAEEVRARAARLGWRYRELDADHFVPLTHPRELADLLLELA
jgi:pimeloyl-ACP methyl ester carboxylesterase